jgi:hypothetical protein
MYAVVLVSGLSEEFCDLIPACATIQLLMSVDAPGGEEGLAVVPLTARIISSPVEAPVAVSVPIAANTSATVIIFHLI